MLSLRSCLHVAAILLALAVCALGMAAVPHGYQDDVEQYHALMARDASPSAAIDPDKPVREDGGLGSLLLKNLRFRELLRRQLQPMSWMLKDSRQGREPFPDSNSFYGPNKRGGDVSVSELAQILNNLKARNVDDDGVKLQSLRFGK